MKKIFGVIASVLIIGFIVILNYNEKFSIIDSKQQLYNSIMYSINRPNITVDNVDIKKMIDIDNKKYILFVSNKFTGIGDTVLTKGINNKYKIEYTEYGSNIFQYRVQETNKNKYFVVFGKNYGEKIDWIKVILDRKEYKIKIPQQEYFISYCLISSDTKNIFPDDLGFNLYDKYNNDITNKIYKEYFK